jgi:hypothetical protein
VHRFSGSLPNLPNQVKTFWHQTVLQGDSRDETMLYPGFALVAQSLFPSFCPMLMGSAMIRVSLKYAAVLPDVPTISSAGVPDMFAAMEKLKD